MSFSSRLSASANFAPKGVNLGMVRQKALKIPQRDIGGARKIFSKTAGKVKTTAQRKRKQLTSETAWDKGVGRIGGHVCT